MTDNLRGTGEEFARIDLGELGVVVIEDDGDDDHHVATRIVDPAIEVKPHYLSTIHIYLYRLRQDDDWSDERIKAELDSASTTRSASGGRGETAELLAQPVSFKCADCRRTFSRTRNTNVGSGPDVCDECADDGGDGE